MSTSLKVTDGNVSLLVEIGAHVFDVGIRHHSPFEGHGWWEWRISRMTPGPRKFADNTAKRWALAYRDALNACRKLAKRGKR